MAKRRVYHVVPGDDGGWDVKKEGGQRASGHFQKKTDAVGRGKELAKKQGPSQIMIHKQDGTFQSEYTYVNDPYPPKG